MVPIPANQDSDFFAQFPQKGVAAPADLPSTEDRKVNQPSLRPKMYGKCINLKITPQEVGGVSYGTVLESIGSGYIFSSDFEKLHKIGKFQ